MADEVQTDDEALAEFVAGCAEAAACQVLLHVHGCPNFEGWTGEECSPDCKDCATRARHVLSYRCSDCDTPHFMLTCEFHHDRWVENPPPGGKDEVWRDL